MNIICWVKRLNCCYSRICTNETSTWPTSWTRNGISQYEANKQGKKTCIWMIVFFLVQCCEWFVTRPLLHRKVNNSKGKILSDFLTFWFNESHTFICRSRKTKWKNWYWVDTMRCVAWHGMACHRQFHLYDFNYTLCTIFVSIGSWYWCSLYWPGRYRLIVMRLTIVVFGNRTERPWG